MQKPHLLLRGRKLSRSMGWSIEARMEMCETSDLPTAMVPRLHQSNGYIKRKPRVWRAQKSNALLGGETALTCAGSQTTPLHGVEYMAENGNMRNFGLTNSYGTAFAPEQWLHKREATGMESSKMICTSWCRTPTYLCLVANYPVSWGGV